MMPVAGCLHPDGAPAFAAGSLEIVWSESGDAVALFENGVPLAIIPSWSGHKGFYGYCRDAVGEQSLAWELTGGNILRQSFSEAREYWAGWDSGAWWPSWRDQLLTAYESVLGRHDRYFAIDGNQWPPKALVTFRLGPDTVLLTLGVSVRQQPRVDQFTDDARSPHRIELGGCFSNLSDTTFNEIGSYISGQASFPWSRNTWLGMGHTIPSDAFSQQSDGVLSFALLAPSHPCVPEIAMPQFRGSRPNLLWMVPIGASERDFAARNTSQTLWERLLVHGGLKEFSRRPAPPSSFIRTFAEG
jgi:hypothetical protein